MRKFLKIIMCLIIIYFMIGFVVAIFADNANPRVKFGNFEFFRIMVIWPTDTNGFISCGQTCM